MDLPADLVGGEASACCLIGDANNAEKLSADFAIEFCVVRLVLPSVEVGPAR